VEGRSDSDEKKPYKVHTLEGRVPRPSAHCVILDTTNVWKLHKNRS